ncbi:MAG: uroporphyrinogen-III synthase [Rhodoferax sp.]|nr:MAG: uroporphyrinogen-III synthase [Rhodoferax sp.]
MSLRVVVTRPVRDAMPWVEALRQRGLDVWALPLIEVRPAADLRPVQQVWQQWGHWDGVLYVSANAVDHFYAQKPAVARENIAQSAIKTIAFAPGPGTGQALLHQGVAPECVATPPANSPQFDSEALWSVVQHRVVPGFRLLVVRGTTLGAAQQDGVGRDWFAAQVLARGGTVDYVVVYERGAPQWQQATCTAVAQAAEDGSVWIFSSSEAIANLLANVPTVSWQHARAICTHPRIAQAARAAGFGVVCESRPAMDTVLASIESLCNDR